MQTKEINSVMWNNCPMLHCGAWISLLFLRKMHRTRELLPRVLLAHTHTVSHHTQTLGTHTLSTRGDSTPGSSLTEWEQRGATRAHQLGNWANQMCKRGANERQLSCSHSCWECKEPPAQEGPTCSTQLPPVPWCFSAMEEFQHIK